MTYSDVDDAPVDGWPEILPQSKPDAMFPYGLPQIIPVPGSRHKLWEFTADFAYVDAAGCWHVIEKGFRFDGASIPAAFWLLVGHPFDPDYVCAAAIHDLKWGSARNWADRTRANHLFREILERQGTASCWDRFSLTTGVWFGKLGNALAFWRW